MPREMIGKEVIEGPLDPPGGVANRLSIEVQAFAESGGVEYETWYHDEPRWLLWREEGDATRAVHIGVFRVVYPPDANREPEQKMFFLPDMYRVVKGHEYAISAEVIKRIRLGRYLLMRELVRENPAKQKRLIRKQIESAWDGAEKVELHSL